MHNVHDINNFVVEMYLYLTCSVKLNIQNIKFKVINQHKNDTCHVQSLEMTFTFSPLAPFTMFSFVCEVFILRYKKS
jgi:hypothetical protein